MIKKPDELRDYVLSHVEDGYIPVYGKFNEDLAEIIIEAIHKADKKSKQKITFLIDSNGGWNDACNAIVARMLQTDIEFTGLVLGKARSNGLRLLMHCKHRHAYRGASLLFHWGGFEMGNSDITAMMDKSILNPIQHHMNRLQIIVEEVHDRTGVEMKKLYELARYDFSLTAAESLELNFIDKIIDDIPALVKKEREKKSKKSK